MDDAKEHGSTSNYTGAPTTSSSRSSSVHLVGDEYSGFTASSSFEHPHPTTSRRTGSRSSSSTYIGTLSSGQSGPWDPVSFRVVLHDDASGSARNSTDFFSRNSDASISEEEVSLKRNTTSKSDSTAKFFRSILQRFGRSYNKRYEYLPNDKKEHDRMVLLHRVFLELFDGRLHLAPVVRPKRVLDLGTGPGDWPLEYARRNPTAEVLGIDLNPVRTSVKLPNCRFEVRDFAEEWNYDEKFDFIHMRMLGSLPSDDVFNSIFKNLNSGGWAEFTEWIIIIQSPDRSHEGSAFHRWNHLLCKALDKMGQPVHYPLELKPILQKKGFPVVYERKFAAPINRWPPGKQLDRLGTMMTTNFLSIIDTISLSLFTTSLGWSPKEVESLLRDVRQEIGDTRMHTFITLMTVFCQKP
ncbi:S-adenosyl-L-methionine-dependent methyltransferase [Hypoxylon fuscum]|nr:S-adenosyl-L-methionine-dependent methyltransferase [Hypoxylon fuscum]